MVEGFPSKPRDGVEIYEPESLGSLNPEKLEELVSLDFWDEKVSRIDSWNEFITNPETEGRNLLKEHPMNASGSKIELLSVALDEKAGHEVGNGIGGYETAEQIIDIANEIGLSVAYKNNGIHNEIASPSQIIYITKDRSRIEDAIDYFSGLREIDHREYGNLMGYEPHNIDAFLDYNELSDEFRDKRPDEEFLEYQDKRQQFVYEKGGELSTGAHIGTVKYDHSFQDFINVSQAFGRRVIDSETEIERIVNKAQCLDDKLEERTEHRIWDLANLDRLSTLYRDLDEHYS
jgi:hypothetical protein